MEPLRRPTPSEKQWKCLKCHPRRRHTFILGDKRQWLVATYVEGLAKFRKTRLSCWILGTAGSQQRRDVTLVQQPVPIKILQELSARADAAANQMQEDQEDSIQQPEKGPLEVPAAKPTTDTKPFSISQLPIIARATIKSMVTKSRKRATRRRSTA